VDVEKDEKSKLDDKVTNEEILNKVGEKRQLISVIRNRQKNWIGHVLRGKVLFREVMEGRMEGKRVRGSFFAR